MKEISAGTLKKQRESGIKILNSEDLFQGAREILIEHHSNYYRLMITKTGKLILNK